MPAYTVHMEQLPELMDSWSRKSQVFVPASVEHGLYDFVSWKPGVEVAWDYDLAYNSLKRFFLPPKEDLIAFDVAACTAEPVFDAPRVLLFGVHPYDVKAITQLDQIMESGSPDQNYMRRRENVAVFAMEPARVADTAFWSSMGGGRADVGWDLNWTKIGPAAFYVEVGSPLGEELLMAAGPVAKATLPEREAARRAVKAVRREAARQGLNFPWEEVPKVLDKSWGSSLWRERAELCLACGSCNAVCPTCFCFDIREEVDETLGKGRRYREWDGCMLSSFAAIAGGHNFRGRALERYRHRYYKKGKYIFDMIGELGCVGCGRCVRACTARIANPMAVYNQLWEETR